MSLTCYFVLAASLIYAIGAKFGAVEVEITISSADEFIGAHNSLVQIGLMARITSTFSRRLPEERKIKILRILI